MVFIQHCIHLEHHCFNLDRQFSYSSNISNWLSRILTQYSIVIQNSCSSWISCTLSNTFVSDTKDLTTSDMIHNNKKYKWCTSCNNSHGAWGFHWKDVYEEWKKKARQEAICSFFQPCQQCTNILLLPNDHQWGVHGRSKGWVWYSEQWFYLPELFWATPTTPKESLLSPTAIFLIFYDVNVALDIAWEGQFLDMESEDNLQPVSQ